MHRVQPSNAPFTHLRSLYFTLGTLRLTTVTPVKTSEKLTYRPFKLFRDYSNSISLLKVGKLSLELKRKDRFQTQKDTVRSIPFTFERELEIWSFVVVVVQGRQQN